MKKLFLDVTFATLCAALLSACSSGSGTNSEPLENTSNSSSGADLFAETFDDLPVCTVNREGAIAYVKDEKAAYACEGGDWTLDDEDSTERKSNGDTDNDGKSDSSGNKKSSASEVNSSGSEGGESSSSSEEPESSGSEDVESSGSGEGSSASVPGGSSDSSVYDADKNTLTDLRDGQVYRTTTIDIKSDCGVWIYSEVWMAENLNFVTENSWCGGGSGTTEGDCSIYGRLYNWAAAVAKPEDECGDGYECSLGTGDIRGACPKGWHVPSYGEWDELFTAVGGSNVAGKMLKSETGWQSYGPGIKNSDTYLFLALPAGVRSYSGNYYGGGYYVHFWSSTEVSSGNAYYLDLRYDDDSADLDNSDKNYGYSVRCLKD